MGMTSDQANDMLQQLVAEGYLMPGYVDSDGVWEDNPEGTYGMIDAYKPDTRLIEAQEGSRRA